MMRADPIQTHKIRHGESLEAVLDAYVSPLLQERCVVALTSKIISILQGRFVPQEEVDKKDLIHQEADFVLDTPENPYQLYLTIKEGLLIPSAGIDESNAEGMYILYPHNPQGVTEKIWAYLREKNKIHELGVLLTDSRTSIMRRGVTGIGLGFCGFQPLYSYQGKPDIYGHPLKVTQTNVVDALAACAVFVMGEGNEQTPLSRIHPHSHVVFLDRPPLEAEKNSVLVPFTDDLYAPLLKQGQWKK